MSTDFVRAVRQVFQEEPQTSVSWMLGVIIDGPVVFLCVHRLCASGQAGVSGRATDQEQQPVQHAAPALRVPSPPVSFTGKLDLFHAQLSI